eukprot:GHVU01006971.1.p1 GENE.GHVU01006971.1~~GHVU01006971.1.p1  ORF type:complete len:1222 (+),score=385.49 GHVU01006971.1:150-3815(+)
MAMDEATLRQVFEGFASEDANRRTEAENAWKATKESNIDQLVDSTVKILLSPDNSQHRQQAAVSIRTILRDAFTSDETEGSEPSSWNKMSAEAKQLLREGLLTGLQKEREKLIRNNICQTVAALALYIMPRKEWPELLPAMGLMMSHDSTQQAVNADGSPKPFAENQAACMQAVALKAAAEMMDLAEWTLLFTTRRDAATQMIVSGLKSCYIEVRVEALAVVAALVSSHPRKLYAPLAKAPVIQTISDTLQTCVRSQYEEETESFLEKLIEIAEVDATFFKDGFRGIMEVALRAVKDSTGVSNEYRHMCLEFVVTCLECKRKMFMKVDKLLDELVLACLGLMEEVDDDPEWEGKDGDDDSEDGMSSYCVGEQNLDRVAGVVPEAVITKLLYPLIKLCFERDDWKAKYVGIMAIAQTVEYLDEDMKDDTLDFITTHLTQNLQHPHARVRHAACHAIGQVALDQQPHFQRNYFQQIVHALIPRIDDPVARVSAHAAAGLVNFLEESDKDDIMQIVDPMMTKLASKMQQSTSMLVIEGCTTVIAVMAGVVEDGFVKYYSAVAPNLKNMISSMTQPHQRRCQGKAIECLSIILLTLRDVVQAAATSQQSDAAAAQQAGEMDAAIVRDGKEVLGVIVQLMSTKSELEADCPLREYLNEGVQRMARCLKGEFAEFLPQILPRLYDLLSTRPALVTEEELEDSDDYSYTFIGGNKYAGIATNLINEMENAVDLVSTIAEVLTYAQLGEFFHTTVRHLIQLLSFAFSDAIKRKALATLAQCLSLASDSPKGKSDLAPLLVQIFQTVFESVDKTAEEEDASLLTAQMQGVARCITHAGSGVLAESSQVATVIQSVFRLLEVSNKRRLKAVEERAEGGVLPAAVAEATAAGNGAAAAAEAKEGFEDDEDLQEEFERDQDLEQSFRSSLLEVLGALMATHGDAFLMTGAELSRNFILTYLVEKLRLHQQAPKEAAKDAFAADDIALALYLCDDVIEKLSIATTPAALQLWEVFMPSLVACIGHPNPQVQQAACYGVLQACTEPAFQPWAELAVGKLVALIETPDAAEKKETHQGAKDNAMAALMALVFAAPYSPDCVPPPAAPVGAPGSSDVNRRIVNLLLDHLPLKVDEVEGCKVHAALADLLQAENALLLGGGANLTRVLRVMVEVFDGSLVEADTSAQIRALLQRIGHEAVLAQLRAGGGRVTKKQDRQLSRIFRPTGSAAAPAAGASA